MLTTPTTPVDAPRAVMWTVKQVADRDGVSKQAVSKKVKDLVERHGLAVERDGQGRVVALNVAEYDHLRGRYGDPSKAQAPRQQELPQPPPSESYDEALRQKTWHEAERRRIELEEMKGRLVPVAAVESIVAESGAAIASVIDRLPSSADDLAAAVARDGSHGLRVALKKLANAMREDIAKALDKVAVTRRSEDETEPEPAEP
ncbi:hypothetical protein Ga0061061_111113 [Chelatococcus sambhunathii]|uniref:Uncharacterized protein n=1 Tax=Chelatococcus sambhunathii TaxID=363953 RepID=A0ABP2A7T2_9HYPH|nr:hypothetical protein Ga0061061_111113 [Chelatococcus sambhunathii]